MLLKNNSYSNIKNTQNLTLSIQVSLDGFCFIIYDETQQAVVHLESFSLQNPTNNPENLVSEVDKLFQQNKNLQLNFTKVKVIHDNELFTIVPNTYFDEHHLKSYLKFTVKTLVTDFFTYDNLEIIDAKTVYIPYVNINNFIFQHFGEFEYEHYQTVLIKSLTNQNESLEPVIYIDVATGKFHLIALQHQNLLLTNSFEYSTKEDFLYYLLFTIEQLKLDTTTCKVFVLGILDAQSSLYQFIDLYIKNLYIFKSKKGNHFKDIQNANSYFTLLNA